MNEIKEQVIIPEIANDKNINSITNIEKEYKKKIEELKSNKSWLRYVIAIGTVLITLFLTSLVAAQIIKGAIAIGVGILIAIIGFFSYKLIKNYDPYVQKKLQNHKIKLLIKEAQSKKIETLTNYIIYLDNYLKYSKNLRNKVDMLIEKYTNKYNSTKDEYLKKEYQTLISKLEDTKKSIEKIVENSKKKKEEFSRKLEISREKFNFIEETRYIVDFLENSENELDKMLVDESLNKLEKEFLEISTTIKNISKDIEK